MDTQCTLPRSAHSYSQHVEADETACAFSDSVYIDLAQKAILSAYRAKGWEGEIDEDGDIQVWSDGHGNAWFTDIRYQENESCHAINLEQQWHRPDETIPVHDSARFNFQKREVLSARSRPARGLDQFYSWMVACMESYPHSFGPDFFLDDFGDDPFFEIPNFAKDDYDGEDDDGGYYDDDDDDTPSDIDPYWKLPPGTLEARAAGRCEDKDDDDY